MQLLPEMIFSLVLVWVLLLVVLAQLVTVGAWKSSILVLVLFGLVTWLLWAQDPREEKLPSLLQNPATSPSSYLTIPDRSSGSTMKSEMQRLCSELCSPILELPRKK